MDTVFRQKQEVTEIAEEVPAGKVPNQTHIETNVEVPFTDYRNAHQKPYIVEHYGLSDLWDDPQGGFTDEVYTLEKYFQHKVETGEMNNSIESVKNQLKEMEKTTNMSKEDRVVVKMGVLSAYAKFLLETEGIRVNARKYANQT